MTGMRRPLGLIALLAALGLPATAAPLSDAQDAFQEGVEAMRSGDDSTALEKFTEVLAEDLSNEAAYELWKSTEHEVWVDMLVKQGQFELIAKRLLSKAQLGRVEKQDDETTIRGLLRTIQGDDVIERARAVRELSANHGEYAVQYMLDTLADPNAEDRRVLFMHTLTEMGTDVVLPLIAALGSEDAYLRRNVALILGYLGDPRAAAALTWHAYNDADEGVQLAAADSAKRMGSSGDALALFLQLGDDYHHARSNVLRAEDYSEVVWSWGDGALQQRPVPRYLYKEELSKGAYYDALRTNPASLDARAGLVRAYVTEHAEIELRLAAGADVAGLEEQVGEARIAIGAMGMDALERALSWAVADGDTVTGVGLARQLGDLATAPTAALQAALASNDGALRSEAAVALGHIAVRSHAMPSGAVVQGLGEAAGRDIMSLALVIDGDAARGAAVAEAMGSRGMLVNRWDTGATGLAQLKRAPGVDVIVLADTLPDLTADQVLYEIEQDERTAGVPIVMLGESDAYADRVEAVITGAAEVDAISAAIEADASSDRARAAALAARAASTLAALAQAGRADLSGTVEALTGTLSYRTDDVTVPAMHVLAQAGGVAQLGELQAVLADGDRSDDARVAAANAMGAIAARLNLGGTEGLIASLQEVIGSDASLEVRVAASRALGAMAITDAQRAALAGATRVDVAQ